MPRRYYRRKYSYKPKRKWCSNYRQQAFNIALPTIFSGSEIASTYDAFDLITNPTQGNGASTSIVKVKNIKLQYTCNSFIDQVPSISGNLQLCILYIPEGYLVVDDKVLTNHPEWIMATKMIAIDGPSCLPLNITMSSRLSRNLNSGDKIILFYTSRIIYTTAAQQPTDYPSLAGFVGVQFWTSVN